MMLWIDRLVDRFCLLFRIQELWIGAIVFFSLYMTQQMLALKDYSDVQSDEEVHTKERTENSIEGDQTRQSKDNISIDQSGVNNHHQEDDRIKIAGHDFVKGSYTQLPALPSLTKEQHIHSYKLLERFQRKLEQKKDPKALTKAWDLVENIHKLVQEFHEKNKKKYIPPIFGINDISPNDDGMKIYSKDDPQKEETGNDLLTKYKVCIACVFPHCKVAWRSKQSERLNLVNVYKACGFVRNEQNEISRSSFCELYFLT